MPSASDVLELRVHGVRNTPPAEMLCVGADEVVPAYADGIKLADNLAGFYQVKDPAPDSTTTLEAYSWGKLDRFGLPGFLGKTGRTFYNLGWFLIAPFGFANVAYWSRVVKADDRREDGVDPGTGASLVRLFGLLLTLLLAAGVATAVMDLVAVQCFRGQIGKQQICNNLPHWFDGLRTLTREQRLATMSPFPILAVVLLAVVGWLGDVRFRTRVRPHRRVPVPRPEDRPTRPGPDANRLLAPLVPAAPRLWIRRTNSPTGVLHIAATVQFTAFLLDADASSQSGGDDATVSIVFAASCILLAVTAAAVLIWAKSIRAPHRDTSPRMRFAVVTLLLSVLVYAGAVTASVRAPVADETAPFTAAQLAPTVLVALLTILAASGCSMRLGQGSAVFWGFVLLVVGVVGLVTTGAQWGSAPAPVLAAFELCSVVVLLVAGTLLAQGRRAPERPFGRKAEAWHGMTPAVTMFLSVLFQAFYASAIIVGTGNWLRGGSLLWNQNADHPLFRDLIADGTSDLEVPFLYWAFGGVMVLVVLAAELCLIALLLPKLRKSLNINDPVVAKSDERHKAEIMAVRRRSALFQRGEPILGLAAAATALGVAAALALTITHGNGAGHRWLQSLPGWNVVSNIGTWVTTSALAAAALVIVGIAVANAARGTSRPIGLLWDLVAWLPRAAHPFGPACYFERAVPELADRMIQWLTDESNKDDPAEHKPVLPDRRVLLATHSLGAVLGIAALYHIAAIGRGDLLPNIRLLTCGVQLRPYFGRFFPELCGPNVLGTHGLRHPRTFANDPWEGRDLPEPPGPGPIAQPANPNRPQVRAPLGDLLDRRAGNATAWRNIWRRTDYLGFPVDYYPESYPEQNSLDRTALEIEPDSYQEKSPPTETTSVQPSTPTLGRNSSKTGRTLPNPIKNGSMSTTSPPSSPCCYSDSEHGKCLMPMTLVRSTSGIHGATTCHHG